LHRGDEWYPSVLSAVSWAPDRIYARGNLSLLRMPCIGLCGSRHATAQALHWARSFGQEAARQGVAVVSGYARGVDVEAHRGVLEAGGAAIAVMPEGIDHFRIRRELKDIIDGTSNFLALSMFDRAAPWAVWRAMERNKLIVGLSSGLLVVEARETGGTIAAAYESMRQGKKLWAVAYEESLPDRAGNRKLLASSALPVSKVEDFREALEAAMLDPPPEVRQLVMAAFRDDLEGNQ